MTAPQSTVAASNRRAILSLSAATCVMCLLLMGLSYFAVNHHLQLHRAGFHQLANALALHPLRYSAIVTTAAIVLQIAIMARVIRWARGSKPLE